MYSHPDAKIRQTQINLCAAAIAKQQKAIAVCSAKPQVPQHLAILMIELKANGNIQITPDGYFKASDGRPYDLPQGWLMNEQVASRLLARLAQRKNKIVIDYEHQTIHAENNGQAAPAAGWVDPADVEYRPGEGLFSPCTWTEKAKAMIEAKEYLYLSPVFEYHPETGEVIDLVHIAITNNPALDGMKTIEALRKQSTQPNQLQEDEPVKRAELIKVLGLADDATDAQIQAALTARLADADNYVALSKELGIEDGAGIGAAQAAVVSLKAKPAGEKPNPAEYVPIAVVENLQTEFAALKAKQTDNEVVALVAQGVSDGKILPAMEAWATDLGNADMAALTAYLEKTPAIAALKGTQTDGKKPPEGKKTQLDDAALAVCKQLNISEEDYLKANPEES